MNGDAMRISAERVTALKNTLAQGVDARFEPATLEIAIRDFDSVRPPAMYHFVPQAVQQVWARIALHGNTALAGFNKLLLLTLIERFDTRIKSKRYPQTIIDQFHLNFHRMVSAIEHGHPDRYLASNDLFMKDLAICRQKLVPAGAEVLEEGSCVPRSTLFAGGPAQFVAFTTFLCLQGGRHEPFYGYHTHLETTEDFNPAGFDAFYYRVAELLRLNPDVRGLTATTWFLDPALDTVSPHLSYIRTKPMKHGAKLFIVGPDIHGGALSKSATRRKLYEEGKYKPTAYRMVWPRRQLIAWAHRRDG
jgi:hypothetical protein